MLKIRLTRVGRKNHALFRLVLTEKATAPQGKYQKILGFYNPHTKEFRLDREGVIFWLEKGAKPSNTASKLLTGIGLKHKAIVVKLRKPKNKIELEKEKAAEEAERQKREAEKEAQKSAWEQKSEEIAKEHKEETREEAPVETETKETAVGVEPEAKNETEKVKTSG